MSNNLNNIMMIKMKKKMKMSPAKKKIRKRKKKLTQRMGKVTSRILL
jgi:hypothetical protein